MKTSQNQLPSLLGAIVFIIGALLLLGIGLFMGVAVLASFARGTGIKAGQTIFLVAFSFEGIILLAAAFFSFQKFLQQPSADRATSLSIPNWLIAVFVIVAGLAILIGYPTTDRIKAIDWLVLPILTIPAIVLPLVVLLGLAAKKLPFGTRWQTWNVLGLAMTLGPLLLFALEIFAALLVFIAVVGYVMTQPELAAELQSLSQRIMILGPNSQATLDLLAPFLTKPAAIVIALIYIAVLAPAIEEIFKPIGLWLFAGKLASQAQGFALGALSGAGYALVETIGVSGQTADWATVLFSRIGTGLMHITTSALMGAAIVLAWRERRYLRLVGTYLLAILFHGTWNALAILFTFSSLAENLGQGGVLSRIQPAMMAALVILVVVLFATLILSNRKMQSTISPSPIQAGSPDENVDTGKTI